MPPEGQLPKDLPTPPTYRKVNPADLPILLLAATSETLPLTEVDDIVETKLAQQISQISGVAQVLIGGQQKPAAPFIRHPIATSLLMVGILFAGIGTSPSFTIWPCLKATLVTSPSTRLRTVTVT